MSIACPPSPQVRILRKHSPAVARVSGKVGWMANPANDPELAGRRDLLILIL